MLLLDVLQPLTVLHLDVLNTKALVQLRFLVFLGTDLQWDQR